MMPSPGSARLQVLLAAASAFAATTHEVVWSRTVGKLVGNTSWAITLTLAFFMVGMGVGSVWGLRLFGRAARTPRTAYAIAELVIAATALIAHSIFLAQQMPSGLLGIEGTGGIAVDVVFASLLVLIPATAMGATYPLLVATISDGQAGAVSFLYGAGLAGGVAGVFATAAILGPAFGLRVAYYIAAGANVAVAVAAFAFLKPTPATSGGDGKPPKARKRRKPTSTNEQSRADSPESPWLTERGRLTLFAAASAAGMGAQVIWNRVVSPFAGVSTYTFAAIVAVYLGFQALAFRAYRVPVVRQRRWLGWAAVLLPVTVSLGLLVPSQMAGVIPERSGSDLSFAVAALVVTASAVALPAFVFGWLQASALSNRREPGPGTAAWAGRIVGFGTLCGAISTLIVGFVLLPLLGPWHTALLLGALAGASIVVATVTRRRGVCLASALGLPVVLAIAPPGPHAFLAAGLEDAKILWLDHGIQDTTAVVEIEHPLEGRVRRLVTNGVSYSGDSIAAQRYMRLLAHLPSIAARERDRALVICVGTGITVSSLTRYPFDHIDAVDISPNVLEATRYFDHVNEGLEDARVHIIVADGDRFLRLPGPKYDVITLEPPPPRAPGGSILYGRDFYLAARERLSPGGVIAQWLPLHGLTGWEVELLWATFASVFPNASLYMAERNEAIILGSSSGRRLEDGMDRVGSAAAAELADMGIDSSLPLAELRVPPPSAALRSAARTDAIDYAWPAPEYAPFSLPADAKTLDAWLREAADRSNASMATARTQGTVFLAAAPAFVRVREGRERTGDKRAVLAELLVLLREEPDNPYVQYLFGHGPLLHSRIEWLRRSGLSREDGARLRAVYDQQAQWAAGLDN